MKTDNCSLLTVGKNLISNWNFVKSFIRFSTVGRILVRMPAKRQLAITV